MPNVTQAEKLIKETSSALHLDAVGFAALPFSLLLEEKLAAAGDVPFAPAYQDRLDPEAVLPGARSFIVILFPYKIGEAEEGNISLYARPKDYHRIIHRYLEKIIAALQNFVPEEQFKAIADTSPMADRWLAWSAGLGFFGKNHCLIHPKYGSLFTIGAIATTIPFPGAAPLPCRCGTCTKCIDACPGRALSEHQFHPQRCKSFLTQKKDPLTEEEIQIISRTPLIFGCDNCQLACPFNVSAAVSPLPDMYEDRVASLSKEELETLSNRGFEKKYKEYAFAWRGRRVLLRNIQITDK